MKIFIFSESEQARELREAEKAKGNSAFLRNPHCFNASDFDSSCEVAYTDQPMIAQAFELKGKKVEGFPWKTEKPKAVKDVAMVTNFDAEAEIEAQQKSAPKRFARKK